MVYVFVDSEHLDKVTFVKAESQEDAKARLKLKETEKIVGCLNDAEMLVLKSSAFAVVVT